MPEILQALQESDERVRSSVAKTLGQIRDRTEVLKLLQQLLSDRSDLVRSSAVEALVKIGDSRAVPKLIQALGDRYYEVQWAVEVALRKIGTPEALNALRQNYYK